MADLVYGWPGLWMTRSMDNQVYGWPDLCMIWSMDDQVCVWPGLWMTRNDWLCLQLWSNEISVLHNEPTNSNHTTTLMPENLPWKSVSTEGCLVFFKSSYVNHLYKCVGRIRMSFKMRLRESIHGAANMIDTGRYISAIRPSYYRPIDSVGTDRYKILHFLICSITYRSFFYFLN